MDPDVDDCITKNVNGDAGDHQGQNPATTFVVAGTTNIVSNDNSKTRRVLPPSPPIPASSYSSDAPEICVICLDHVSEKAIALPCHHDQFDFLCLGTWIQQSRKCPLCKGEIRAIKYYDHTYGDHNKVTGVGEDQCGKVNAGRIFYLPVLWDDAHSRNNSSSASSSLSSRLATTEAQDEEERQHRRHIQGARGPDHQRQDEHQQGHVQRSHPYRLGHGQRPTTNRDRGRGRGHPQQWNVGTRGKTNAATVTTATNGDDSDDDNDDIDAALQFRKTVYARQMYSAYIGSNRRSRYQNITPQSLHQNAHHINRAKMFIRRELRVFDFLTASNQQSTDIHHRIDGTSDGSSDNNNSDRTRKQDRRATNAEFLLEYVVAILQTIDLKSSTGQAQDLVADFLGRPHASLFLHELEAWLRSPFDRLVDWDRHVQYL